MVRRRNCGVGGALLVSALLTGCTHYTPRPVDPAAMVAARPAYDSAAVQGEVARIAPGAATDRIDALNLFAAALLYNPDIAAARAGVASAQAAARASRAAPGPTLTLSSEYANDPSTSSNWLLGGAIDVPLDIGGRRAARLTNADLTVAIARYDYAEAVWTARMAIRRALAARLIALRQVAVLEPLLALRQRHFAAMQRRVNAGAASRTELERVRADLADTSKRLAEARSQTVSALAALSAASGIPQAVLSTMPPIWDGFDQPEAPPAVGSDLRIAGLVGRADVLKAIAAYDMTEADLRGEVAKQFPAITLSPGYTWERGLVKLPFNVGLALPPLDLNRRNIASAEAKRAESGKKMEAIVASAGAALDAARIEASASRDALAGVRAAEIATAARLARAADAQIKFGAIDRTEWAAAQAGIALARLSELDALARIHTADAAVEDALRRPLLGPETAIKTAEVRP